MSFITLHRGAPTGTKINKKSCSLCIETLVPRLTSISRLIPSCFCSCFHQQLSLLFFYSLSPTRYRFFIPSSFLIHRSSPVARCVQAHGYWTPARRHAPSLVKDRGADPDKTSEPKSHQHTSKQLYQREWSLVRQALGKTFLYHVLLRTWLLDRPTSG